MASSFSSSFSSATPHQHMCCLLLRCLLCVLRRTDLLCIMGPFWPCLVFVTIPLILLVSGGVALHLVGRARLGKAVEEKEQLIQLCPLRHLQLPQMSLVVRALWGLCTTILVVSGMAARNALLRGGRDALPATTHRQVSLVMTACCDPGIARRWNDRPQGCEHWQAVSREGFFL